MSVLAPRRGGVTPRWWTPATVAIAGTATAAGVGAATLDWRLAVPLGLGLPLVAVLLVDVVGPGPARGPGWTAPMAELRTRPRAWSSALHDDRFVAGTWTALLFGFTLQLLAGARDVGAAASGQLSGDILLELSATGAAGLIVLSAFRAGWPLRVPRLAQVFALFALVALASVVWSVLPLFSLVRGGQFVVLAGLVAYTASRAATEPGFFDRLLARVLRYTVVVVLALSLQGLAAGGLNYERFSWRGSHPNTAAALMLLPVMGLAFSPRRAAITRPLPWWSPCLLWLPLVYETGSRATVGAAVFAAGLGWLLATLHDQRIGGFGIGVGLVLGGVAWVVASERILEFVMRGQDGQTVSGLNGRVELWNHILANPIGSEVWGVGVGAARRVVPLHWEPTNGHNAWIDLHQTLGVIGTGLMGAVVVGVLLHAVVRRSVHGAWLAGFVLISSFNSTTISRPDWSLVLLGLAIVATADVGPAPPDGDGRDRTAARTAARTG